MESSLITLMRHAKSSWQNAQLSDHERPLNPRGKADAPIMAQRLIEKRCTPDLIICSSARRALQTGAYLVDAFQLTDDQFQVNPDLYLAAPQTLLDIIQGIDSGVKHAMIIAHNPGLAELSCMLAPESSPHLPTAGIRHFSWPKVGSDSGSEGDSVSTAELIFEDYPKKLFDR